MSLSPEHPDPTCPHCAGRGNVPAYVGAIIDRVPCAVCKAREYDARCPRSGALVTLTPGWPCEDCGAPSHPPAARPADHVAPWRALAWRLCAALDDLDEVVAARVLARALRDLPADMRAEVLGGCQHGPYGAPERAQCGACRAEDGREPLPVEADAADRPAADERPARDGRAAAPRGASPDEMVRRIDAVLDGMERRPRMYGSSLETVEVAALQLLELRRFARRPDGRGAERVVDAWRRLLAPRYPNLGNGFLCSVLEGSIRDDEAAFPLLVRELAALRRAEEASGGG